MAFTMAREADKALPFWIALAFIVPLALGIVVGLLVGPLVIFVILGLGLGLLAATFTFTKRAEKAMFAQAAGQEGAAGSALMTIRRGWSADREPIAIDTRTHDMVFRAVGRGGVVLVAEGPVTRVKKLVDAEKRKLNRVVPNAPVHVIYSGEGEGQTELRKIAWTVQKIRPTLSKEEAASVAKRLKSLGGLRPATPKGMDPNLMRVSSRRARRG